MKLKYFMINFSFLASNYSMEYSLSLYSITIQNTKHHKNVNLSKLLLNSEKTLHTNFGEILLNLFSMHEPKILKDLQIKYPIIEIKDKKTRIRLLTKHRINAAISLMRL